MTLDPRTPVLVGAGQLNERAGGREPVDLITDAARAAALDAGAPGLLAAVDSVRVVGLLSWRYRDPGRLVGERIGASPRHTGYTGDGGSNPQALVNGASADIAAGRADVVLIGGAEAWRTRTRLRARGSRPDWTRQDDTVPAAPLLIPPVPMSSAAERRIGLDRPAYVYPLFEHALRIAAGRGIEEQRDLAAGLWSAFSKVAATNPHAWQQREYSAAEIRTPSPDNRWISAPYTKLMNSNNMVEQGASLLLCSVAAARRHGVPRDRWVFPQSGAEAHDTYAITERGALHRSPAIRFAAARALELAGAALDDVPYLDVYSCFPSAVQVAAAELGLPLDDPARPLTLTGGLTFAGGPWNNYSTHAIATLVARLRDSPGAYGMVTANGGYLTKHAIGIYRTDPPPGGFRHANVQDRVDAEPVTRALDRYEGAATVETWTVAYDRDGAAERGFVLARTPDGARTPAAAVEPDWVARLAAEDVAGAPIAVTADGHCLPR
ncbi:acetyl-CoA acetyltransferase [Nocardia sp. BMG111209]|uniref:acetyl-CoA acetyltransferase n=1 Tax=Nocardia sp. BMG111209 TaxID=1160137 RepID=UPI000370F8E1|nr:acetyl-CoA acetyltransferase [Nocardia sp. BMG111209]